MHATTLIAHSLSPEERPILPCAPTEEICCVTGQRGPCIPRKLVIPNSYTGQDAFVAPQSVWVGVDVYTSYKFERINPKTGKPATPERTGCWWTDGREFRILRRAEIREMVLDGSPSTPWAMWVTTSYKKHGSARSPVNTGTRGIIGFDELKVSTSDGSRVKGWWQIMSAAQRGGIGRTMQETVSCPPGLLKKVGIREWLEFERWAYPRRNDPLYRMLCYLLPSLEELKGNEATANR